MTPTLWRSCRVLANPKRLRLLRDVAASPDGLTVGEAARRARLPMPVASQYLRALGARGLLTARRIGPRVRYVAQTDPAVVGAAELLRAMTRPRLSISSARRALTAFTHPRRIELIRQLSEEWLSVAALRRQTKISAPALKRHLAKLQQRGLIERNARKQVRCGCPPHEVSRVLLALARSSPG